MKRFLIDYQTLKRFRIIIRKNSNRLSMVLLQLRLPTYQSSPRRPFVPMEDRRSEWRETTASKILVPKAPNIRFLITTQKNKSSQEPLLLDRFLIPILF